MAKKALSYTANSSLPISIGDTTPNPGMPGVSVWSTIENSEVWWNGATWQKPGLALSDGFPADVSNYPSSGVQTVAARGDHTHAHGQQSDPTHHALVTYSDAGFMSPNDKILLDAISTEPEGVELATLTATPVQGTGDVGVSQKAAREDHAHAHGTHTDGTLHAGASGSASGFMSPSQFTKLAGIEANAQVVTLARVNSATGRDAAVDGQKLDSIEQGATNTLAPPLAPSAAPPAIGSTGSAGSAGTYATATHTHAGVTSFSGRQGAVNPTAGDYNSSQIGNSSSIPSSTTVTDALNYIVNTLINGKAEKTTSITAGPGLTGGGTLASNLTLSVGVINNTQHGNLSGGALHALASYDNSGTPVYTAGFMSGQDKALLDNLVSNTGFPVNEVNFTARAERTAADGMSQLYVQDIAGREMLAFAPKNNAISKPLQPHVGMTRWGAWDSQDSGPALKNWQDVPTGTVLYAQGNAGLASPAIAYATSAVAGTSAGTRMAGWAVTRPAALPASYYPPLTGFHYICRFGFAGSGNNPSRWFVGLADGTQNFNNSAEISAQLIIFIGFGSDSGDTVIQAVSTTATTGQQQKTALPALQYPKPLTSDATQPIYEAHVYCGPDDINTVSFTLRRLDIFPLYSFKTVHTLSSSAVGLYYRPIIYVNNFITASAVQILVHSQYLESNR